MSKLIVVGFKKDLYRASEVLNELIDRNYDWTIDLRDAVAAYRDYNGKLRIDSSFQVAAGEDAVFDGLLRSLVGFTLGAIAAPVTTPSGSAVAGGVVAAGALDTKWWKNDFGISDEFVQDVGALVQPGDSAIYALLRMADPTIVSAKFRDYGGVVQSTTLSPEQAKKCKTFERQ